MRFSINIPNFGDFADPRAVAKTAAAAEEAGWDALLVWDHVVHLKRQHGGKPFGDQIRALVAYVLKYREHSHERPFEVVLGGKSPDDPAKARTVIEPLAEAGATWSDERQLQTSADIDRLTRVLRRIHCGPPAV